MDNQSKKLIYEQLLDKYGKSLLTKQEYASELGISVSTVDNYIARGKGVARYIKLGDPKLGRVFFPLESVAEFLSNTVEVDNG